ncbi:MAG TPA: IS66 family transposase [Victivallales bacterium]|nr:IS66 family transposase [Victivallales bacterium]
MSLKKENIEFNYYDSMLYLCMVITVEKDSDIISENKHLKQRVSHLEEQVAWYKRQIFGSKSERYVDAIGENPDLPGFESISIDENTDSEELNQKKTTKKRKKIYEKGKCTLELPDDLPIEEIVKDIPKEERFDLKTGKPLVEFDREAVDKLAYKPGSYYIKRTVYVKYAVVGDSLAGVTQATTDDTLLRGSKFDESFIAHVIAEKLAYHTPLYRQQEKLFFNDIKVERQTLSSLIKNVGIKLEVLYNEMKKQLFTQGYLFSDDTPVKMLTPGKGKTKETRMWIYEGASPNAPPYKIYQFTENRKYEYPKKFLHGFKGTVHADAYGAYVDIDKDKYTPINWAACWAHGRRKFEEAQAGDKELKKDIMKQIQCLSRYERIAWSNDAQTRLKIRQKYEKPIVDKIYSTLKIKVSRDIMLPKEKLTIAVNYMLFYEVNFRRYLTDPNIRMDNNAAERSMRKIVLGKKNWMFIGSPTAGKSMGILYSFVQTCRVMKIDPQKYLEDVFRRLQGHPHQNLRELLPDRWTQEKTVKK